MPTLVSGPVYEFSDFRLDSGRFEIRRNGGPLRVERKPMELLILLASREGQLVTRAEIAEHLWSNEVFVDTEHGINTAIRKIRSVLRDDPENPRFVQTVTGMGYRFLAPVTKFEVQPPEAAEPASSTLVSPEPAEIPSEKVVPDRDTAESVTTDGRRPSFRFRIILAAAAGLVLAIAGIVIARHSLSAHPNSQPPITSIAVLPLANFSGDAGQDYFAEGMTDELITMLARDSTLRVTSRTSVMQYKDAHRPLAEIAGALHVDGILEGSVSRSGNRVHMTLQLIRGDTDTHLWAESYDRDANDVALPDEAAKAVAEHLHRTVSSVTPTRYVNPAAHDAYLHGKYLWFSDRMEESGAWFRKAIEIQPDYGLAWAGLADYYGEGIAGDILDPRTSIAPEEQAAERALELDPNLPQAHQAMGAMFLIDRWDWVDADREILRAISLDPQDGELYYLRACLLLVMNRDAEVIETEKKAMELDPFSRPYALAAFYEDARQYDAALAEIRLRLEASPDNPDLLAVEMDTWRRMGKYKEAVDAWAKWHILTGDPQSAVNLRRAYDRGGARGFIRWQLGRRLMQSKSHYVSPVELASYYAQLGDKERTLALLEEGYSQHATDILWIQRDPAYDFLHSDPRFRALVQETGVPPIY